MAQEKKVYTREEKIKYYQRKVLNLEYYLQQAQDRLHYLMSDNYQDWNGQLPKELAAKKAAKKA